MKREGHGQKHCLGEMWKERYEAVNGQWIPDGGQWQGFKDSHPLLHFILGLTLFLC